MLSNEAEKNAIFHPKKLIQTGTYNMENKTRFPSKTK
jgi:hypothetical protein